MTYDLKDFENYLIKTGRKEIDLTILELDLSAVSEAEQAAKVIEEYDEFILAHAGASPNNDHIAEETMDLMQALCGYLLKRNINIAVANKRHLEKLRTRIEERLRIEEKLKIKAEKEAEKIRRDGGG